MSTTDQGELGDWEALVVEHAGPALTSPLRDLLLFDRMLARAVLTAKEPALAQLRLAWWREELVRERGPSDPSPPDPLLGSLLGSWAPALPALEYLIDGWEAQLAGSAEDQSSASELANGRSKAFTGLAVMSGAEMSSEDAGRHGAIWGYAEALMIQPDDHVVRAVALDLARELPRLPRTLRPLAMIGGLSRRSIKRGGEPLLGDRLSPLVALRLGIFGT